MGRERIAGVCLRTYTGHVNEKNFVGLSVTSDGRIACGSEDNTVRMYAKFAPLPVAGHSFMRMTPGCGLREEVPGWFMRRHQTRSHERQGRIRHERRVVS